jgi:hypothetical protein
MTSWKNVSGSSISVPVIGRDVAHQETVTVPDNTIMPGGYFSTVAVPTNVITDASAGTVSWDPPAGGPDVVDYLVDEWPGGFTAVTTETSVVVADLFSWLFSGTTAHTFMIRARSVNSISMSSVASAAITPVAPPVAPTNVVATPTGITQSEVSWTAPVDDGGGPIDTYVVTSDGPNRFSAVGTASPVTVEGLISGDVYTFTVQAGNSAGLSDFSASSGAVVQEI